VAGTGRKGTEVGKGRAGSRIPKVVGNGRCKEVREPTKIGWELGLQGMGWKWEV